MEGWRLEGGKEGRLGKDERLSKVEWVMEMKLRDKREDKINI